MKPILNRLLCGIVGSALGVAAATAQTVNNGDLLLGVQAGGNPGQTTNVFVNLGPGHVLRDTPNAGVIKNINAELTTAFGADWFERTNVYFGVIANRNASFAGLTENGDPTQTFYLSRGGASPGGAALFTGYSSAALRSAGTFLVPQVSAVNVITANSNGVRTMSQSANPVEWSNSWSVWNPIGGGAYDIFTGGIQNNLGKTGAAFVDVQRLLPGVPATYVTTIALTSTGNLVASTASSFVTLGLTVGPNGAVTSTQTVVAGDNSFPEGQVVNLTAVPDAGFAFDQWSGDFAPALATSPSISVTMSAAKALTATFKVDPKSLALTVGADGTVAVSDINGVIDALADEDVNSPTFDVVGGTELSLVPTADVGFEFVRWLVDGVARFTNPLVLPMDADVAVSAEFASVANTTGPANGFSDSEVAALEAFLTQLRVGDTVSLSLPVTLAPGTRLVVTGLPAGLTFNASTRTITGTVLAELGDGAVSVQIRTVATNAVVESISLRFVVLPFLFAGAYEAIIENASNIPVGRVRLTVTSPTSASAVLQLINEKGLSRTISGTRITFGALSGNVLPANLSFPVVPAPSSLLATTAVMNLEDPSVSDLVTGTQGSVPNTLRGFRLVRPGRSPVQPVTVAFENGTPGDRLLTPGGSGFGTGTVNGSGVLPLTGSLGDGQSFTTTLRLSETNQAVVWMQPYTNKVESFIGGIIDVGSLVIPGRGGPSPSTPIADGLRWAKSVRAAEKSYPGGFGVAAALGGAPTTPLAVDGFVSKWFAVGSVQGLANTLGLTARNLNATYVAPPVAPQLPVGRALPAQLNLRGAFSLVRLTPANSVGWSGTAVPTNGRFKGSPVLVTPLPASVRGVFLQDPQSGAPTKVGVGFMRIPTNGTGSFQTSGVRFDQ